MDPNFAVIVVLEEVVDLVNGVLLLDLTVSEDLLSLSVQESPYPCILRVLFLKFNLFQQLVAPFYHGFCHCSQRAATFYLETLTTTTDVLSDRLVLGMR